MHCLECDYDLRGLTEHRCPECGRAFSPTDPKTFRPAPISPMRSSASAFAHVTLLVAWVVVGFFLLCHKDSPTGVWQLAAWIFLGGTLSSVTGSRIKDILISLAVLTVFLDACLLPNCGHELWYVALIVPAVLAILLFSGFYLWRLVKAACHPD